MVGSRVTASVARPLRLDPFQLPAATTARFVLLVLLTLTGSAYTYDWYFGGSTYWGDRYDRCGALADSQAGTLAPDAVTGGYLDCTVSVDHVRFGVVAAAVAVVALVVVAAHVLSGPVLIRWRGLVPPPAGLYPDSVAEVRRMVADAGLRRAPTLLVDPHRDFRCGRVFGCFPRYYLRLNLGVLRGSDSESAALRRAIVRHELAHLGNRDVDVTGLTIAAGRVFAVLVAAPLVVLGITRAPQFFGQIGWRLAIVLLLVTVVRAAVIRSREHYADVAASVSGIARDQPGFLAEAFPEPDSPTPGPGRVGRLARRLGALVRMHPSSRSRVSVVADPGVLLTIGALEALTIGLTMGLSITYLSLAAALLLGGTTYSAAMAAFLLSLPAIGALVAGLWRATLRALATRTTLPTGTAAGVGLWAGLLLGEILMRPFGAPWPAALLADPVFGAIDAVGLLVGCLLFTRWSVGAAAAWLPAARGRSLRPALAIGQLIGAAAFGGALGVWLSGQPAAPGFRSLVPHVLWLDTPEVAALAMPRLRVAAVLVPPLAVLGTAVVVHLLTRDGVVGLAQTVAAAHGLGPSGLGYAFLAMVIAPTIVIVPLVLAMTSGPASAGLGPAHAVLAAALSSFLAAFVVGVRTGVVCGAPCGGLRRGWESLALGLPLAEGLTLYAALALLTVIYVVRGPLRRLFGTPRRWPVDEVAADRPTRRPARPLRWSFALLVLAMSLTASYGVARQTLLPARLSPRRLPGSTRRTPHAPRCRPVLSAAVPPPSSRASSHRTKCSLRRFSWPLPQRRRSRQR